MKSLRKEIFERHDIYCNQTYGDGIPYSFHLGCVHSQGYIFKDLWILLWKELGIEEKYSIDSLSDGQIIQVMEYCLYGHDLIEDARMTYNNVINFFYVGGTTREVATFIADVIYDVTDEKGKDREGRKNKKYYKTLRKNKMATFIKFADIAANRMYGKLTGSSMYENYVEEFSNVVRKIGDDYFKSMIDYIDGI